MDCNSQNLTLTEIYSLLYRHRKLIVIPTILCTAIAALYATITPRPWAASQGFVIRGEAVNNGYDRIGKFSDLSEMKTLQETILELAKSQEVLSTTLTKAGAPGLLPRLSGWPTKREIDDFRHQIKMTPPDGSEFGKTEVFYLSVLHKDSTRASKLVSALCDELESQLKSLRNDKARSMVVEFENTATITKGILSCETAKLATFEASVGADLNELRHLISPVAGNSSISEQLRTLEIQRQNNDVRRLETAKLIKILNSSEGNVVEVISLPASLLNSQPALNRMKEALIDARVFTAGLQANFAADHPHLIGAIDAERRIAKGIQDELVTVVHSLKIDQQLIDIQNQQLLLKIQSGKKRLENLAHQRAEYAGLIASVDDHTKLMETARKGLIDAQANQAAARTASLIVRIGQVDTGINPVGIGTASTTLAGGCGGLLLGFGLVFMVANPVPVSHAAEQPTMQSGESGASKKSQAVPTSHQQDSPQEDFWKIKKPAPLENSETSLKTPSGLFQVSTFSEAIRRVEHNGLVATK